mmetsp:Transcript_21339/g.63772  ORF Transcript_21339/g.63772 Transcript_21339/m.63772 type:complete len:322 (+) Transcript_21339:78-1043(+)
MGSFWFACERSERTVVVAVEPRAVRRLPVAVAGGAGLGGRGHRERRAPAAEEAAEARQVEAEAGEEAAALGGVRRLHGRGLVLGLEHVQDLVDVGVRDEEAHGRLAARGRLDDAADLELDAVVVAPLDGIFGLAHGVEDGAPQHVLVLRALAHLALLAVLAALAVRAHEVAVVVGLGPLLLQVAGHGLDVALEHVRQLHLRDARVGPEDAQVVAALAGRVRLALERHHHHVLLGDRVRVLGAVEAVVVPGRAHGAHIQQAGGPRAGPVLVREVRVGRPQRLARVNEGHAAVRLDAQVHELAALARGLGQGRLVRDLDAAAG